MADGDYERRLAREAELERLKRIIASTRAQVQVLSAVEKPQNDKL